MNANGLARAGQAATGPAELPLEGLIGRATELTEVIEHLDSTRFVTITGLGGTGKTRLAQAVARSWKELGREAVFVDLAPLADPELIATAIADQFAIPEQPDVPMIEPVIGRLSTWQGLLILDNLEQFVAETAPDATRAAARETIDRLAHASSAVSLLLTSRLETGVRAEAIYPLGPLAVRSRNESDEVTAAGPALFLRDAGRIGVHHLTIASDLESIIEICNAVGGLPLGIQLAAARTRVMSPAAILAGLRRKPGSVATEPMEAIIEWTANLLDPAERAALAELSLFPAEFDLREAATVWSIDDPFARIDHLVRLGLVMAPDEGRFQLPIPVREWTARQLPEVAADIGRRRLISDVIARGDERRPDLIGMRVAEAVHDLRRIEPLMRSLLDWGIVHEPDLAADIIHAVGLYWFRAERVREVEVRCADLATHDLTEHSRAVVLSNLAEAHIATSSPESALPQSLAGLVAARRCGARDLEMRSHSQLGRIYSQIARHDESRAAFADALVLAREDGDEREVLTALGNMATNEMVDAKPAAALALFDEAERIARRIGDRFGLAMIITNSAYTRGIGEPGSVDRLDEASSVFAELGRGPYLAWGKLVRITALAASGRSLLARSELNDVLSLVEEVGTWSEWAQVAEIAAAIIARDHQDLQAAGLVGRADRIRSDAGNVVNEASDPWFQDIASEIERRLGSIRFARARREGGGAAPADLFQFLRSLLDPDAAVPQPTVGQYGRLSRREEEVLQLVGRGMTDPEIATELGISAKTASVHVSNIKSKLGLETRIDVAVAGRSAPQNE